MFLPPALKQGDTIGIFAPSKRIPERDLFEGAIARIQQHGYKIFVHPQTWETNGYAAGTGAQKAKAFHDLLRDPEIKAIFCAAGGNRAATMLEHLDFNLIREQPKIFLGYSDVTALLNANYAKAGLIGFHGPMILRKFLTLPEEQLTQTFALLGGQECTITMLQAQTTQKGSVTGRLLGGNLSILCSLLGTPYAPDFKDAILFLEDVGDELSRFDRYFLQLRNAGILAQIGGMLIGSFTDLKDSGSLPFGFTMREIIANAMTGIDIPVVLDAPFGHGPDLYTFPVGGMARLYASGSTPTLTIDAATRAP